MLAFAVVFFLIFISSNIFGNKNENTAHKEPKKRALMYNVSFARNNIIEGQLVTKRDLIKRKLTKDEVHKLNISIQGEFILKDKARAAQNIQKDQPVNNNDILYPNQPGYLDLMINNSSTLYELSLKKQSIGKSDIRIDDIIDVFIMLPSSNVVRSRSSQSLNNKAIKLISNKKILDIGIDKDKISKIKLAVNQAELKKLIFAESAASVIQIYKSTKGSSASNSANIYDISPDEFVIKELRG
ncbi:hypothetical protein [Dongshaea marina]|uniref:hypothetical protein n=1 Tax=Dongshaea marina TaxID=2047966 RepID=UPI00131EFD06|nr:hypothetical protein [Dongshaea marina]